MNVYDLSIQNHRLHVLLLNISLYKLKNMSRVGEMNTRGANVPLTSPYEPPLCVHITKCHFLKAKFQASGY